MFATKTTTKHIINNLFWYFNLSISLDDCEPSGRPVDFNLLSLTDEDFNDEFTEPVNIFNVFSISDIVAIPPSIISFYPFDFNIDFIPVSFTKNKVP